MANPDAGPSAKPNARKMPARKMQWSSVKDLFQQLDQDASGTITLAETEERLVEAGYSAQTARVLFAQVDQNCDGTLTLDELKNGITFFDDPRKQVVPGPSFIRRFGTILLYFLVGSIVYGILEGWSPLDTCDHCAVTGYSMSKV